MLTDWYKRRVKQPPLPVAAPGAVVAVAAAAQPAERARRLPARRQSYTALHQTPERRRLQPGQGMEAVVRPAVARLACPARLREAPAEEEAAAALARLPAASAIPASRATARSSVHARWWTPCPVTSAPSPAGPRMRAVPGRREARVYLRRGRCAAGRANSRGSRRVAHIGARQSSGYSLTRAMAAARPTALLLLRRKCGNRGPGAPPSGAPFPLSPAPAPWPSRAPSPAHA